MSCEIRSMITRYPLGSAILTPPSFTNSAVTPSTFMLLIFSTTAGGKVFSMPNKIPIFFIRNSPLNKHTVIPSEVTVSQSEAVTKSKDPCASSSSDIAQGVLPTPARLSLRPTTVRTANRHRLKIFPRHPLPQRPIVFQIIPPNIQPMRNSLLMQHGRHFHILIQTHIPVRRCQHNLHLPVTAQKPIVIHVRHEIRRTIEITIIVVISIEKLVDVIRPAHGHAMSHRIRM